MPSAGAPPKAKAVSDMVGLVYAKLDTLGGVASRLVDELSPVLKPDMKEAKGNGPLAEQPILSPVASNLQDFSRRLTVVSDLLDDALQRLEV